MAIDRRMFLIGASIVVASAGIGSPLDGNRESEHLKKPRSAKLRLAGKKLVPPKSGLIKVACVLTKDVTLIDWVGPAAVFGAWIRDDELKRDRPVFEVFTVGDIDPDFKLPLDYSFQNAPQP